MDSFFDEEAEVASSSGEESVHLEHSDEEVKQKKKGKKRKRVVRDSEDEEEAEVTSSSGEESVNLENSDEEVKQKKKGKKRKRGVRDSDDEEDGEELDQNLDDLINDDPIEDDENSESGNVSGEGEKEQSDLEEDLDDEDYDLLEENLGTKFDRKYKRRRIRSVSDDDEPVQERDEESKEGLEHVLFDDGDQMSEAPRKPARHLDDDLAQEIEDEEEDESDVDDFIVGDDDQPITVKKKKRRIYDDAALQEAQEIFGTDLDFELLGEMGEEEEEEDQEEDYDQDVDEEAGEPRPVKTAKKKKVKTTIYQVYEPSELERSHFTEFDQDVRMADMPERFQLRDIPVCPPMDEMELEEEARWIFKERFNSKPISKQEYYEHEGLGGMQKRPTETIHKIREALNLMRNQKFEVPFIAFYRKEFTEPELNIKDLWEVYRWDEKWMELRNRKRNLLRLFERMQHFQFEQIDPEKPLESHFRTLTEEDLERVKSIQNMEELRDVYQHFMLYYGNDIPKMKAALKAKKRQQQQQLLEEGAEEPEEHDDEPDVLKHAKRKSLYMMCVEAGLVEVAKKFGLTPEQFGENLRDNYQKHDVEQHPEEPLELAQEFIKGQFATTDAVMNGAKYVVAMQLSHDPVVRQCVRQIFYERAKISVRPTKKGLKEIDESHVCYTFKYIKDKPVRDLMDDQFLKIVQAEGDKLLTYEIYIDQKCDGKLGTFFKEIEQLFHRDEFSIVVQEWNKLRSAALEITLDRMLYPLLVKELKTKLLEESKECIRRQSGRKLYNWLKVAPYQVDQPLVEDDEEYDTSHGLRIMGLAYSVHQDEVSFGAIIDGDGEVTDYLRLPNIMKRRNVWHEKELKEKELQALREFIATKKPHVIAVSAESREALYLVEDIKAIVAELESEKRTLAISVELVDAELGHVYANSKKAEMDLREYPKLLRQAVSLARRLQDPLIEFSQLCNADEEILCLQYHPMQSAIDKDELLETLNLEFVNRVNEVGVDVNRCLAHPHTAQVIQFVCGLGPRKGFHLLKQLKQHSSRLENRTQLVTSSVRMGPKVFINCAGFIKIDTAALGEMTETYVEVLDSSRIHPETYEWARKMAVDALEYDDTAEDANPSGALEEILESPERLKDLDLDAFAEELDRTGYGDKHITLYDIRAELSHRYKDLRTPYRSHTVEERFNLLTKETPQTFYIGRMVNCPVTGIAYRRPQGEQLEMANPVRNDETGLWQCPFCQKNDFPELGEVWNHFDAGGCPGQAVGVKTMLDNGVFGYIPLKNLSDSHVSHPEERVRRGMVVRGRITKIDIERFQVELTCKTSDLMDADHKWRLQRDHFYDYDTEEEDKRAETARQKHQRKQVYMNRVIVHPSFHNIDYVKCVAMLETSEQGEAVIRPSSKGTDNLTATWKVTEGIFQHIDIREEGKSKPFSLGKRLWIGQEEFEDIDEIIARHIQPMAAFVRDVLNYKNYKDVSGDKQTVEKFIETQIISEKKMAPNKIPYYLTACKEMPGIFRLSYLPRKTPHHEYISVKPEGFCYRKQMFHSLGSLIRWFKEHYRDIAPDSLKTPVGVFAGHNIPATPSMNLQNVDNAAIQRAAAVLPNSVYSTLQQVAGGHTPYGGSYRPYQGSVATPMLTPGQPHHMPPPRAAMVMQQQTPHYPVTPNASAGGWPSTSNYPVTPQQQHGRSPRPHWVTGTPVINQTPGPSHVATPRPAATSTHQDWGKMAQLWAQNKTLEETSSSRMTPRARGTPRQSPYVTPVGDSTPLIDER